MQFSPDKAIYLQIIDLVMEKILTEEWKIEEKIISIRELGAAIEVNPNTVMRAYEKLQQDEIIYNKRGIGYFVDSHAIEKIRQIMKKNFVESEAPKFFQNAKLLNISIDELITLYKSY